MTGRSTPHPCKIRFWGVRGSIAAPGVKTARFGGNTACVEISAGDGRVIFDAGTGIRNLGDRLFSTPPLPRLLHIFFSHFHIDHLCGLPFFRPLFEKRISLHLYGPEGYHRSFREIISSFFSEEFFPVPLQKIPADLHFHSLGCAETWIPPFSVRSFPVNHPGRALGYSIRHGDRKIVYISDHEPIARFSHLGPFSRPLYERELASSLLRADLLIHDAHFRDAEYESYRGWGHSPWSYPVSLAERAGAKRLVLFHHAPGHDDRELEGACRELHAALRKRSSTLRVTLAKEGETITL